MNPLNTGSAVNGVQMMQEVSGYISNHNFFPFFSTYDYYPRATTILQMDTNSCESWSINKSKLPHLILPSLFYA